MKGKSYHRSGHWVGLGLLSALLFGLAGCGSSGTVSGKVLYKGNPLPAGTRVTFLHEKTDRPFTEQVNDDGTYTIEKVPPGKVKIGVVPPHAPTLGAPNVPGGGGPQAGKKDAPIIGPGGAKDVIQPPSGFGKVFEGKGSDKPSVEIPDQYKDPRQSGLTLEVTGGKQKHDIEIP
jgi:hypothetical protein